MTEPIRGQTGQFSLDFYQTHDILTIVPPVG
jgi:hypothetical protein